MPPLTFKQVDNLSNDIKKLIKAVTNIQEDDQNFTICQKFIFSNFLYHRYLDVIAPDVWKKAENLHSKLVIQAQSSHARVFCNLIKKLKILSRFTTGSSEDELCSVLYMLMKISRGTSSLCLCHESLDYKEKLSVGDISNNEQYQPSIIASDFPVYDSSSSSEDELFEIHNPPIGIHVDTPSSDSGYERTPDIEIKPLSSTIHQPTLNISHNSRKWLRDNILNDVETDVVREQVFVTEILWMLRGVTKLSFFNYQYDSFSLKDSVRLCSLNHEALSNFIKPFTFYANCVVNMKNFVNSIIINKLKAYHFQSKVFEAFASSLFHILQELLQPLQQFEKEVYSNVECWTLIKLQTELQAFFSNLHLIYQVFEDGINNVKETLSKRLRVGHLLTVLGEKSVEAQLLGTNQYHLNILLTLLLNSCKPYFHFIQQLINGKLVDTYEEFAIERNKHVEAKDDFFWDNILILHQVENEFFLFGEILPYILLAGKSVEVLAKLGFRNSFDSKDEECLYNLFSSEVLRNLGINLKDNCSDNVNNVSQKNELDNYNSWMNKIITKNSLLSKNFQQFILKDVPERKAKPKKKECFEILDAEFECRKPLPLLLRNCLIPLIMEKCQSSNQKAIEVLTIDHNLLNHLNFVRSFYLLEAGESMLYFCSNVFDKMLSSRNWTNVFTLNSCLNEVTEAMGFSEFSSCIFVAINEDSVVPKSPLDELLKLQLIYNVPWPINIILDNESMKIYQKIFTFLMQIKCVKYVLDQLRFSKNSKIKRQSHILHLLKMKFLCTINSIHNYFMIGILHTIHTELRDEIDNAKNVKDLVDAHQIYLAKLQRKCFLAPNLYYLKDAVFRILNLAISFSSHWNCEINDEKYMELYFVEQQYKKCLDFFSAMIKIAEKRGDYSNSAFNLIPNHVDINLLSQEF